MTTTITVTKVTTRRNEIKKWKIRIKLYSQFFIRNQRKKKFDINFLPKIFKGASKFSIN